MNFIILEDFYKQQVLSEVKVEQAYPDRDIIRLSILEYLNPGNVFAFRNNLRVLLTLEFKEEIIHAINQTMINGHLTHLNKLIRADVVNNRNQLDSNLF